MLSCMLTAVPRVVAYPPSSSSSSSSHLRANKRRRRLSSIVMSASSSASKQSGSKPLVVVGSVNADYVLSVERLPAPGETVSASTLELFPGGKGANQAAAAARLGHPTRFIGQTGKDGNGTFMRNALTESGVVVDQLVERDECSTGTAYIFLQPSGENSIVILGGANQEKWEISERNRETIGGAGAVLLQREIPEHVNLQVARMAKESGVPVILDAGGVDAPLDPEILGNLAVLSPNETELARLTGLPTSTDEEMLAAATKLLSLDVGSVLIKLGARGSVLIDENSEAIRQDALPVDQVVDTTGAGDCYTAAFAVGYVKGWPKEKCLLFASAAASACIQKKGAMVSLPRLQDIPEQYVFRG